MRRPRKPRMRGPRKPRMRGPREPRMRGPRRPRTSGPRRLYIEAQCGLRLFWAFDPSMGPLRNGEV